MKDLRMPASYAILPDEELYEINGGGELKDAWDTFTKNLHLDDFFFRGGLISVSISFVPMLLFNVLYTGYQVVQNVYDRFSVWFGLHDDTLSAVQSYTHEMQQKHIQQNL